MEIFMCCTPSQQGDMVLPAVLLYYHKTEDLSRLFFKKMDLLHFVHVLRIFLPHLHGKMFIVERILFLS